MTWVIFGLGVLCGVVVGFGVAMDSAPNPLSEPLPRLQSNVKPLPASRVAWTDHSRN